MITMASHVTRTPGPTHIAVLVDTFAKHTELRDQSRQDSYHTHLEHISTLVIACLELGVPIVTLGLTGPEQHTPSEADDTTLIQSLVDLFDHIAADLHALGVAVRLLGDLPEGQAAERFQHITTVTRNNTRLILNLVFTYDSRADIAQAMQRMRTDGIRPDQVTEDLLSSYLLTHSMPDPDLIIQTGGRLRLGNFLLWQAAYAEYYAAPVGWLDFDRMALRAAISAYATRERRFGAVPAAQTY